LMGKGWIYGDNVVQWSLALPYSEARLRCLNSPKLFRHMATILDDAWADDADHLRWVNTAKVIEIVAWAESIEGTQ